MIVASSTTVISRRHVNLAGSGPPRTVQPYHAARGLSLPDAEKAIERAASRARTLAGDAIREVLTHQDLVGCGLGLDPEVRLPSLATILASHPLLHAAEGQLFRVAIADAARDCGLMVMALPEKELRRHLPAAVKPLGPPWREDEKLATAAALLALAL